MLIDWPKVQRRLGVTPDGAPGRVTYAALFRFMGPSADAKVIASLGNAAAVHFAGAGVTENVTRLADFMAQTANESGGYTVFEERLSYSAKRLTEVWPGRFPTIEAASAYANNPRALANKTYGGRMGNTGPDDGWLYRGRGLLQLTGRANYEGMDRRLGIGLDINPDIAAVPALSLLIALEFYEQGGIWAVLDRGDTKRARQITNGGTIGLDHVNALRAKIMGVLG